MQERCENEIPCDDDCSGLGISIGSFFWTTVHANAMNDTEVHPVSMQMSAMPSNLVPPACPECGENGDVTGSTVDDSFGCDCHTDSLLDHEIAEEACHPRSQ